MNRRQKGTRAEQVAASYLRAKGYTIDTVNWRQKSYELDIVARNKDCLVFVEVKSSRNEEFGPPQLKVTAAKQRRLTAAASEYLAQCDNIPDEVRFDVIAIIWPQGKSPNIEHLEGAFMAIVD